MTEICPKDKCTGCMACAVSCSHNAIEFSRDELGFLTPRILENKCVNCGLCRKICPSVEPPTFNSFNQTFAGVIEDNSILQNSSSGGLATLISEKFIRRCGVVYGCSGVDIFDIHHIRVDNTERLSEIQGSKYVQSKIYQVLKEIRNDLKSGLDVLFIGLPCQVAAVKKFLLKEYNNLYTIDLICHGVASQKMINEDVDYYKKKFNINVINDVKFRSKSINQDGSLHNQYGMYFSSGNRTFAFPGIKDCFTLAYYNNQLFRDSCYQCQYTKPERVSDLTLGDFWGLGADAGMNGRLGVSVCILHTTNGKKLLDYVRSESILIPRETSEAIHGNPQLITPCKPNKHLNEFRKYFIKNGLVYASHRANLSLIIKINIIKAIHPAVRFAKRICRI